jgi:hypothetical protein
MVGFPPQGFAPYLTQARAELIDNLQSESVSGTITHPAGVAEIDALEVTPAELTEYSIVLLDVNALTQNTTIRTYIQVNGVNYRLVDSAIFPTDFPTNVKSVPITLWQLDVAWKITLQSAVTEGVDRDIPYRYVWRTTG